MDSLQHTKSIVLYGAKGSGKTSTLQYWSTHLTPANRASEKLLMEAHTCAEPLNSKSEVEAQTLEPFEYEEMLIYFAPRLPARLYAVDASGNARPRQLLADAHAICFVVDSDADRHTDNQQALEQIIQCLRKRNVPIVVQYNKRDAANAASLTQLKYLNPWDAMAVESVASEGLGVWNTLTAVHRAIRDS